MTEDVTQGSLAEIATASGRSLVREGFGRTEADDVLYGMGWPRLTWLEPGDATAKELASSALFSGRYPFRPGTMPIGVVPRRLRSLVSWRKVSSDSVEAQNDVSPIDVAERDKLFAFALTETYGFTVTFMLEALFTTRVVLDGYMARIRKLAPKALKANRSSGAFLALHWLLRRTEPGYATSLREELSAIHKAAAKLGTSNAIEGLDLAINGRAGVERSGEQDDDGLVMNDLEYAIDDLDYVRDRALAFIPKMKSADRSWLSTQVIFLGGDDVLAAASKHLSGIHASARDDLALGLSRCARPVAAKIVTALSPKKKPSAKTKAA